MFLNPIWASPAVKTRKRTQKSAPMRLAKAGVLGGVLIAKQADCGKSSPI